MFFEAVLCFLCLNLRWDSVDATYAASPCPAPDWLFHPDSNTCYYVKNMNGLSFYEAQQYCNKIGHEMAQVKSEEVLNYLSENYKAMGNFWIGLSSDKDGKQEWEDGSTARVAFWDDGFPTGSVGGDAMCAYVEVNRKKWRDTSCYSRKYKIACQIPDASICVEHRHDQTADAGHKYKGDCDHKCIDSGFKQRVCKCDPGYTIFKGTKCQDINECDYDNGGCDQDCNNTIGSYTCTCKSGTPLLNGRVCKSEAHDKGWMTMELISLIITVAFPATSIVGCILMALWRKKKIEEANKSKVDENEQFEGEGGEEEGYDDQEHYDENYEEEDYDYDEQN